jgi:hypothetical protein
MIGYYILDLGTWQIGTDVLEDMGARSERLATQGIGS